MRRWTQARYALTHPRWRRPAGSSPRACSGGLQVPSACSFSETVAAGPQRPSSDGCLCAASAATVRQPAARTSTWWLSEEGTRGRRRPPQLPAVARGLCSSHTAWTRSVRMSGRGCGGREWWGAWGETESAAGLDLPRMLTPEKAWIKVFTPSAQATDLVCSPRAC